jgi:hypothetical protein
MPKTEQQPGMSRRDFLKSSVETAAGLAVTTLIAGKVEAGQSQAEKVGETLQSLLNEVNQGYAKKFETDSDLAESLIEKIDQIRENQEYSKLSTGTRAELAHKLSFIVYTQVERKFRKEFGTYSAEEIGDFQENLAYCKELCTESLQTELVEKGFISSERQRTLRHLLGLSEFAASSSILLKVRNPGSVKEISELAKFSTEPIDEMFKYDPRMRGSQGLYVFSKGQKEDVMKQIVGLAKFNKDLPEDMDYLEAAQRIGGAEYTVDSQLVPWINAVLSGTYKAQPAERAFIDKLITDGVVVKNGSIVTPGKAKSFVLTTNDNEVFTHEMAHRVHSARPEMTVWATSKFNSLSKEDKALFFSMMQNQNPDFTPQKISVPGELQDNFYSEFFAYTNQSKEWREKARQIVNQSKPNPRPRK